MLSKARFNAEGQRIFTREEVGEHRSLTDAWVVYEEGVYNITSWIPIHPGGEKVLFDRLGRDVTVDFKKIQHSLSAVAELEDHKIGIVETPRRYTCDFHNYYPAQFGEEGGFH